MTAPEAVLAGRYRLRGVVATGGMGVVWEAWDERLERQVAIKQLRIQPGLPEDEVESAKKRAMREGRITARLHHPHAVPVFDAVEHEGQPCLIMPFLPSTPLSAVLREQGALLLPEAVRIGAQISSALAAAHAMGIVHRDVKPGNVLITEDGAAHISDFGISQAVGDASMTRTGLVYGTPAYLAPEVARGGDASFASDVFSLGATLYAAVEGSPPFGTGPNSIALLHKVATEPVPPPTNAGALTPLLLDMLASEPDARPSMEEATANLADHRADTAPLPPVAVATAPGAVLHPAAGSEGEGDAAVEPEAERGATAPRGSEQETVAEPEWAQTLPREPEPEPEPQLDAGAPPPRAAQTPAPRRRRPFVAVLAAAVVVAALGLLVAMLTGQFGEVPSEVAGERGAVATSSPPTGEPTPAAASPSTTSRSLETTASPDPEAEAEPEAEPDEEPQAEEKPRAEPGPRAEPDRGAEPASQDRATRLTSAITDYYALLPDNTDQAWPLMTADYQSNHSGGREAYEGFWDDFRSVAVSDVQADPPDRVEATLTYQFHDGRTVVERTAYRLVDEGGTLKIDESTVLSSSTQ